MKLINFPAAILLFIENYMITRHQNRSACFQKAAMSVVRRCADLSLPRAAVARASMEFGQQLARA